MGSAVLGARWITVAPRHGSRHPLQNPVLSVISSIVSSHSASKRGLANEKPTAGGSSVGIMLWGNKHWPKHEELPTSSYSPKRVPK